jgi:hypothetical protein
MNFVQESVATDQPFHVGHLAADGTTFGSASRRE